MMLSEGVFSPSLCVFAEIVGGKLRRLAEEGAELEAEAERISHYSRV